MVAKEINHVRCAFAWYTVRVASRRVSEGQDWTGYLTGDYMELMTVPQAASALGIASHQLDYFIRTRRIQPTAKIGGLRVFDVADVEAIRSALGTTIKPQEGVSID